MPKIWTIWVIYVKQRAICDGVKPPPPLAVMTAIAKTKQPPRKSSRTESQRWFVVVSR